MKPSLLVVTGEISGDSHTGAVLQALRTIRPDVQLWGIGGPASRAAGMATLHDIEEMAVMGLWDVLLRLPFFRRVFREVLAEADRRKPTAALLVDYPGFNMRLAAELKQRDIPVLYYICPQVWAWRRSRIRRIAEIVDRLLVLFPFEAELFSDTGLETEWVGHPLADTDTSSEPDVLSEADWPGTPRIAILPGSRRQEIEKNLPVLLEAARRVSDTHPGAGFRIAAASDRAAALAQRILDATPSLPGELRLVSGQTQSILRSADAAWVTSGTATLEAAIQGCPTVVVYRTALLTYLAAKAVVRIPTIGLVNIVAGRTVCPELIQHNATPKALAAAIEPLLSDTEERRCMVKSMEDVTRKLGAGNAYARTADAIDRFLSCRSKS